MSHHFSQLPHNNCLTTSPSMSDLYNQPVVIDNGSGNIKAGFAGEDKPRAFSNSIVGTPKYQKIMPGTIVGSEEATGNDSFLGNKAQEYRGLLRLSYPIQHGVVENWHQMEMLWNHIYQQELHTNAEDHPLLITEAPLNPRSNRDRMCQVLFETFNVPCLYLSLQAILSLYASGRTTGVVIDSGDGVTHVVPAFEGFSLPTCIKRMDIAGRDITDQLIYHIRRMSGVNFKSSSEFELARSIKEKCCFVSKDPSKDERMYSSAGYSQYMIKGDTSQQLTSSDLISHYKLPDGHVMQLGAERFRASEILFNPQLIGEESPGLAQLTANSLAKTDIDLRPTLYNSIILSGGNTLLRGMGDRLLLELKLNQSGGSNNHLWSVSDNDYHSKMKVKIYAPPERKYSTWIGGSILAGLSTFKRMWVTAEEYGEDPEIVHRKCM